jgi:signal recognition particle receptor subunit beta
MVLFNYSTRELTAKIVFYGPGLCGKTTNLQYIHSTLPDNVKGKMLSLATKTDRTLFFDFLPIDLGQIRGMKTRVQLYTVPGQVFYNETRKLVLKGADGIVFVADSQSTMLGANVESFKNLEENLKAHGLKLAEMPHVLQFNKRDLPRLASIEELNAAINRFNAPFYESVATTGIGVQDTLKAITKLVLLHLTKKYDPKTASPSPVAQPPASARTAPAPPAPPRQPVEPPRARPLAAPPTSTAHTMQMPAASVSPARGVPISSSPMRAADERPEVPSFGDEISFDEPASPAPEPSFGDEEIQELVDEVQGTEAGWHERSFGTVELPPEAVADAAHRDVPELAIDSAPQPTWSAPATSRKSQSAAAAPGFEIDHGIDPAWSAAPRAASGLGAAAHDRPAAKTGGGDVWDIGAVDEDVPAIDPHVAIPDARRGLGAHGEPASRSLPRLTEVVTDSELFDDPGIDIARMMAGEEREVVVPVEFQDGDHPVRRFKLSIRLRMDAVS